MKGTILLNYNENTRKVEEEEKYRFLRAILEQIGIPIEEFWIDDNIIDKPEQRIKLRNMLAKFGVQVIDDMDGHMQIYVALDDEVQLAAEWFKCKYKLKRDLKELDPKKQLYLEMEVNYWSIFEETE